MHGTELLCDLGECDHSPLTPPRAGHTGEQVYCELWQKLMAEDIAQQFDDGGSNCILRQVLRLHPIELTQRLASVAASFIKWLGTNCGQGFLHEARRTEKATSHGRGFIAAWAVNNFRESWCNSGFRAIEYVLALPEHRRDGQLFIRPELSADDYEAVESVVAWLSSENGKSFVARCDAEISARVLAESVAAAVGRRDFALAKLLLQSAGHEQRKAA